MSLNVRWRAGCALATAVLTAGFVAALPGIARAEVLFDHLASSSFGSYASQDSTDSLGADDFEIPPGEVWLVQRFLVDGTAEGAGAIGLVNASLFASEGTLPADDPVYAKQLSSDPNVTYPTFGLTLSDAVVLPPGTWWLGVQAIQESPTGSSWYWQTNVELSGNPAAWRNPSNSLLTGCLAFVIRTECFGAGAPDNSFRIEGARAPSEFVVTGSRAKHKGRLKLTVNAPNLGTLDATSRLTKPAGVEVTAPGEVELKLKPNRKAKDKLADGKRPKARLTLVLPPFVDGTPLETRFRRKLKP